MERATTKRRRDRADWLLATAQRRALAQARKNAANALERVKEARPLKPPGKVATG